MTSESGSETAECVSFATRIRGWVREYPFALAVIAFELLLIGSCIAAHEHWNAPLQTTAIAAKCAVMVFSIVSIFCDRTSWPGILLFWANIFPRI